MVRLSQSYTGHFYPGGRRPQTFNTRFWRHPAYSTWIDRIQHQTKRNRNQIYSALSQTAHKEMARNGYLPDPRETIEAFCKYINIPVTTITR